MKSVLVALSSLIAPGFAHGLMGQRRAMVIAMAATYVSMAMLAFTVWAFWGLMASYLTSLVHAGLIHRRLGTNVRWTWLEPTVAFVAMLAMGTTLRVFVVEAFSAPSTSMSPAFELGDTFFINKLSGEPSRGDVIVFRHPCQPDRDYLKRVIALAGDKIEVRCTVVYVNGVAVQRELVNPKDSYMDIDPGSHRGGENYQVSCSRYRETLDGTSFEVFHDPEQPNRDRDRTREQFGGKDFPTEVVEKGCPNPGTAQRPGKIVVTRNEPGGCEPQMHLVVPDDSVFVMGDNRANSNDSRFWGTVPVSYVRGRVVGRWLPFSRFGSLR